MTDITRCEFCAGRGEFAGHQCENCGGQGFRFLIPKDEREPPKRRLDRRDRKLRLGERNRG
jgi:hypothetical protein